MDKWREIWNKSDRIDDYILETLIKADGFDSGAGSFTLKNWKTYTQDFLIFFQLNQMNLFSTLDVGAGHSFIPFIYQASRLEELIIPRLKLISQIE